MIPIGFRIIFTCWFLVSVYAASVNASEPIKEIRETTEKILGIVNDPALNSPDKAAQRNRLIRQAVDERFDWVEMSRRTLAVHWRRRTEAEKKEFIALFGKFLEMIYLEKVEGYTNVKVIYDREQIDGDYGTGEVRVVTSQGREVPVLYRLKKKAGEWYVYDVSIEGASLIDNYRAQFNSIIVSSSYANLIKQLKAKVGE